MMPSYCTLILILVHDASPLWMILSLWKEHGVWKTRMLSLRHRRTPGYGTYVKFRYDI